MQCQSAFPKPVSVPGPNLKDHLGWICPAHQWTAAAASYPGAGPLHVHTENIIASLLSFLCFHQSCIDY